MSQRKIKKGREIERKFLMLRVPEGECKKLHITQHYVEIAEPYRVRKTLPIAEISDPTSVYRAPEYDKTIKILLEPGVYDESIEDLTLTEYREHLDLSRLGLSKVRHIFLDPVSGLKWEVDVFDNCNLIVAEIEIPSIDYDLKIPEFVSSCILIEVTEHPEFTNYAIAKKLRAINPGTLS